MALDPNESKSNIRGGHRDARSRCAKPLVNSGSLNRFKHSDLTPVIGREYLDLQVADLLASDDQLIKDLAITSKSLGTPASSFDVPIADISALPFLLKSPNVE